MKKLFLIFNHQLTDEQIDEARVRLGVSQFVSLPEELQNFWGNIAPDVDLEPEMFSDLTQFLLGNRSNDEDYCLVQGDFGATVYIVSWCFKNGFVPIYSTTKRVAHEIVKPDGTVEVVKLFRHERFRRYILYEGERI